MATNDKEPTVISLISLGCAKNNVDSERILGKLAESGFLIAEDPARADLCLVNTCGFIHDAREESAGVLRELQKLKKGGQLKAVVALGCLVERVTGAPELNHFLDQADAKIGFQDYPRLAEICRGLVTREPTSRGYSTGELVQIKDSRRASFTTSYNQFLTAPRMRIGSPHLACLKISEGCSNFCKFCSIPRIRGIQVSRPMEDLLAETRQLLESGAREIGLIAQDTTSYGRDIYGTFRLAELLRRLAAEAGGEPVWFRLMYAFPRFLDAEMLDVLASDSRFCPYIDIPLQHINDRLLADMGRGMLRKETVALLDLIREKLPHGAIRTTFIVGYPGETGEQFNELLEFVAEGRFSHAGVFMYSKEPKTLSANLDDNVPPAEKKRRRDALMRAQLDVSRRRLKAFEGREVDVMLDGPIPTGSRAPKGCVAVARSRLEAPEVDGMIFLRGKGLGRMEPGTVLRAHVTESMDYDLVAEPA
ncbi:MAG: 30S ribosomal protein S12 methylthiotransferase RimO [bacterium]